MPEIAPTEEIYEARLGVITSVLGDTKGFVCVAAIAAADRSFQQKFYKYPQDLRKLNDWVERNLGHSNLYFCPHILKKAERTKEVVQSCRVVWADLDQANPDLIDPYPSIVIKTSPSKFQAYWLLDRHVDPYVAEDASKRIAYEYESLGADTSGWDLSQLLRIPYTYNYKYAAPGDAAPLVDIVAFNEDLEFEIDIFAHKFDAVPGEVEIPPFSYKKLPKKQPNQILQEHQNHINEAIIDMYRNPPVKDWSSVLWKLECSLFEAGLERGEVFVVAKNAACNKYLRDDRADMALWREVCKAEGRTKELESVLFDTTTFEREKQQLGLLTTEEWEAIDNNSIVDKYVKWASSVTDADPKFHKLSGFMLLSVLLGHAVRIPTDYGKMGVNLWGILLANTTIARKSTSMRLAMDFVEDIKPESFLASDGSIEGIMDALSFRPGKVSVFLRDEFTGLFQRLQSTRDYHAGMAEDFAKLYDGDSLKRVLRKETILVNDPVFCLFAGGIRDRIFDLINPDIILNGFLPRFIFAISNKTDFTYKSRRPKAQRDDEKNLMRDRLWQMYSKYQHDMVVHNPDGKQQIYPKTWDFDLTPEAWDRFDQIERKLGEVGMGSSMPELVTPFLVRLTDSILKCSALLAAARTDPQEQEPAVEVSDLLKAASYAETWAEDAIEVCASADESSSERLMQKIVKYVEQYPEGVLRSTIMRMYRLSAAQMDFIMDTLSQRGLLISKYKGKGERWFGISTRIHK